MQLKLLCGAQPSAIYLLGQFLLDLQDSPWDETRGIQQRPIHELPGPSLPGRVSMKTGQHETPHGHTTVSAAGHFMAPHSFLCSKKSSAGALPTSQKGIRSPENVPHVACQQFHVSILQPGEGWPHLTPLLEADNRPLEQRKENQRGTMAGSALTVTSVAGPDSALQVAVTKVWVFPACPLPSLGWRSVCATKGCIA